MLGVMTDFLLATIQFYYLCGILQSGCKTLVFPAAPLSHRTNTTSSKNLMYRDYWRYNIIIIRDNPKKYDVDWVFCFHQCKYESAADWNPKTLNYWNFCYACQAVLLTVSKSLEEWIVSWCCSPHSELPTDRSLLHSRQNLKQIMYRL